MNYAYIKGVGSYVPQKILTNFDLEKLVNTNDEWIFSRTGIRKRHIADSQQATSDLAVLAAKKALKNANIKPENIDLIIVATSTPDYFLPASASMVQHKIKAKNSAAFDLNCACAGFVYALANGSQFIISGTYKNVLVIGAEIFSRIVNWKDRNTCILFGDAAGAVLLSQTKNKKGILSFTLGADGSGYDKIIIPAGGSKIPASIKSVNENLHYITMKGKEVFEFALRIIPAMITKITKDAKIKVSDITWVIPHQANIRIIESALKKTGIPMDKVIMNIKNYANTSAASIPLALDEAVRSKKIKDGDLILMVSFGAGLNWSACLIKR